VSGVSCGLALTETAALSHWNGQELRRNALPVNELVRRAVRLRTDCRALGLTALSYYVLLEPSAEVAADRLRLDVRRASVGVLKEMAVLYPVMGLSGHELGKLLPARRCEPMLTRRRSRA
jgi:hypothetical protein